MPKKTESSSDEYVVLTSGSISSYVVDASCDCYDSDTCDTLDCSTGQSCSSSSKCCCSESSDCSSCKCCSSDSSGCSTQRYDDSGYGDHHYQRCYAPQVPQAPLQSLQAPVSMSAHTPDPAPVPTTPVPATPVAPSSVIAPRNKSFRSVITPIINLRTPFSPRNSGTVAFTMRRKNDVVTLQHEPFSATIAANGINHLAMCQSLGDLPSHPVHFAFPFRLNGVGRMGFARVDPLDGSCNFKFFLDPEDSTTISSGDTFETSGGSFSWITSY